MIISGMRRSGNHFITEWLINHYEKVTHYNNWSMIKNQIFHYENGELVKDPVDGLEIYSYEDVLIESDIYILRDWYNMSASRLVSNRGWYTTPHNRLKCPEIYLQMCKLYEQKPEKFILYNKLITDNDYKEEVEDRMGLDHIDLPSKTPKSKIGSGSSFDNLEGLNERYKQIMDHNDWKYIKSDFDINYYMIKIFGIEV